MPRVIDCHYMDRPLVAAAYLLADGPHAAFVDNNTARALPRLLGALETEGLRPEQVDYLIVTHVHLDHAGGTSALAAACPNATVLCHPRAARHLLDPTRLEASARTVYGDETFERLYGRLAPVLPSRLRAVDDGEAVPLGSRTLRFLHTRGHANHHLCILDESVPEVYTGDAFGLRYPFLQRAGTFIFPSTSPTDFDPMAAREAIRRIVDTGAQRAYLAHFGEVSALGEAAAQLLSHLDDAEAALAAAATSKLPDAELPRLCAERLGVAFERALAARGLSLSQDERDFLRQDLDLNAQGVAYVAARRRKEARPPPA